MASNTISHDTTTGSTTSRDDSVDVWQVIRTALRPLSSLKLTVALFALAILLIFVGTLAQDDQNMWEVMDQYFYSWFARVELQVFLPRAWFPTLQSVPGAFYMPGGALIGWAMFANLLAAHLVRFKVQTRGRRLWGGLAVTALGVLLTWFVIASGHNNDGLQGRPPFEWSTLWLMFKLGTIGGWFGLVATAVYLPRSRSAERILVGVVAALTGVLVVWMLMRGSTPDDASLRILWQLIKALLTGLVILAGCIMAFKKRAGIVVLHAGVGLMMVGLFTGRSAVEERMMIAEGETMNFTRDIRSVELAVIDRSSPEEDRVVAVPLFETGSETRFLADKSIAHESLPFDIEIVDYLKNSVLVDAKGGEENPATKGHGLRMIARRKRAGGGADSSGAVDMASAYVKLLDKESGEALGTYLLSQELSSQDIAETVEVDGKPYDVSLRFRRTYKPYTMHLIDVRKEDYLGTSTPKDYSSFVHLVDPTRKVDREIRIWMNNPLRYAGETFYQSNYMMDRTGREITDLQVVRNSGWLIPYVACMIVFVGMLAHFSLTLTRFINRRTADEEAGIVEAEAVEGPPPAAKLKPRRPKATAQPVGSGGWFALYGFPALMVLLWAGWLAGKTRPPETPADGMQIHEFGELPVVYQGRVKPLDTLARNSLRIISNRETFEDEQGDEQPAIRWLLDVIAGTEAAEKHPVFRIENHEVLQTLGLKPRKGLRYSVEELRPKIGEFEKQVDLARQLEADELNTHQRKILELDGKIRTFTLLAAAFQPPQLPALPTREEFEKDHAAAAQKVQQFRQVWAATAQRLNQMQPPLAVPVESDEQTEGGKDWQPYANAWMTAYVQSKVLGEEPNPATLAMNSILVSYARGDAAEFNREVAKYNTSLKRDPPSRMEPGKIEFETLFNHFAPFYHSSVLYVVAFLLTVLAWLAAIFHRGARFALNRAAFCLIAFTLLVHTLALVGRIYISGRPPVTNLYSSAIFIGWACVVLGLALEALFRIGIGNIISAVSGFATLLIAHFLAGDGDTFTVLQAVLDTQFWLATHVVCITLGYATTFAAGLLGIVYIVGGVLTPALSSDLRRTITRATYGIICFAIFFSFIGTVLGGLWADDSWGRFWGWDPKENGALIIVLWNALILHARWGNMVRERGFAVLAVVGNIVTSWSWFGVNELGIGLHSYGFTEGVKLALAVFVGSQLAIMMLGALPKSMWWSHTANAD